MVVRLLDMKKDSFRHCEKGEDYLVLKYHILASLVHLCILLYVLGHILLFFVNLLARRSFAQSQRH